jgi:hypothetical protein
MSEAIRQNVFQILALAGVAFSVRYVGETKRPQFDEQGKPGKAWECDQWEVCFSLAMADGKSRNPPPAATMQTAYHTGLGLRQLPKGKRPWGLDNTQNPRELARWKRENAKPVPPHAADVLHSLLLDSSALDQSFADWCSDYGYSADSLRALDTYRACCDIGQQIRRMFTHAQREALQTALQDY